MDWNGAIEQNSAALKRIVAMLVEMARLSGSQKAPSPSRRSLSSGRLEAGPGGLDTAPPLREGEDSRPQAWRPSAPPQSGGEVPSPAAKPPSGEAERGTPDETRKSTDVGRPTLPRRLHGYILRLLRPAESAVRRLIVIAARGLVVPPSPPPRPKKPKPPSIFVRDGVGTGIVLPGTVYFSAERQRLFGKDAGGKVNCPPRLSLPLFDRLKRPFERRRPSQVCAPRISYPGPFSTLSPVRIRIPPTPDDPLDATRLTLRLDALAAALDDLPKQARRLARWRANRARDKDRDAARRPDRTVRFRRLSPLRPGRPPGSRRRPDHEVYDLLTETHSLAFSLLNDTS